MSLVRPLLTQVSAVGSFQDLEEDERGKKEDEVKVKKNLFVINCEVKILEDWFLGQRDILQIKLEMALSV
jgi:hypothetical protein